MGRRREKETRIVSVHLLARTQHLTPEQATRLEAMLRCCRSQMEFEQVSRLVHQTCADNKKTRYGKIASGDPLGFDEDDD